MLQAPEQSYVSSPVARQSRGLSAARRGFAEDFAGSLPGEDSLEDESRRRQGFRVRLSGSVLQIPGTIWGRIAGVIVLLSLTGCLAAALLAMRQFFLHDSRFLLESSSSVQVVGSVHVDRAQLLSVFGEDIDRNIFHVPLAERREQLEALPWVAHATVMRLLPDHLRIAVKERTPVAFVRQGSQIGMADAHGVLLDIPPNAPGDPHYSFPVVTGISAADPLSIRAARMKIYSAFLADLDSTGARISEKLSEVDLSNPNDVRAIVPEGGADILVHFGDMDFLSRYQRFEEHLQEWRTAYPKLASVDMRYDRQVVLDMGINAASQTPIASPAKSPSASTPQSRAVAAKAGLRSSARDTSQAKPGSGKPAQKGLAAASAPGSAGREVHTSPPNSSAPWHMVVVKPHTRPKAATGIPVKPRLVKPKPVKPLYNSQAGPQ